MDRPRLTTLLTWAVVGTYLLVALGATAAADAGPALAAAHHVAAVLVGLLLVATAVVARRAAAARGVRIGTAAVVVAYPVQAGIGLAGRSGVRPFGGRLHLLGGIAVFAVLLATLIHRLETTAGASVADDELIDAESPTDRSATASAADSAGDALAVDSAGDAPASDSRSTTLGDRLRAYLELTKPRLMWLLCLLALAGMGLATATGAALDGVTVVATLGGGVLAIGAAGTFNHVYERDRDRRMRRTADRPVATDRVGVRRAVAFGVLLVAVSMAILLAFVNVLATVLTALAVVYYAYVYTVLLKPTTRWNTVIGGGSGALPALIGYAAVTGTVGLPAVLLAVVVCCWTPAHFYNLAIAHREDYARADYPMLPVVAGVSTARRRILAWLGITLVAAALLGTVTDLGLLYALATTALGAVFVRSVVRQYDADRRAGDVGTDADAPAANDARAAAYRSFHASNAYLGAILGAILLETLAF
ncbi:heme o synthase [Halopenitus persicus]|uniref:Protoheme IX farnesyltransferase n=1 Tax=Halopenitus persicus TaxID=1048396 RepID=A0A1H3E7G0_9EURY|nr:heme o synthase [Halopenitus persicus]QHS17455.1 protoheme IX farnesyltransferase [haloarchaeon 3A1-DGR]SDX74673.1 protoheme IX farnesyltransferase [Halopenitus persicus]